MTTITRYLGNMCYNLLPRQHLRYYCKISISLILVFSSFESQITLNNYHLQFHHFKNGYILVQYILTRPSVLVYWSAVTSFLFVTPSFVFTITDRIGMYYKNWREGLGMRLERSIYIKYIASSSRRTVHRVFWSHCHIQNTTLLNFPYGRGSYTRGFVKYSHIYGVRMECVWTPPLTGVQWYMQTMAMQLKYATE